MGGAYVVHIWLHKGVMGPVASMYRVQGFPELGEPLKRFIRVA